MMRETKADLYERIRELDEDLNLLRDYTLSLEEQVRELKDELLVCYRNLDAHRQEYIQRLSNRLDD